MLSQHSYMVSNHLLVQCFLLLNLIKNPINLLFLQKILLPLRLFKIAFFIPKLVDHLLVLHSILIYFPIQLVGLGLHRLRKLIRHVNSPQYVRLALPINCTFGDPAGCTDLLVLQKLPQLLFLSQIAIGLSGIRLNLVWQLALLQVDMLLH